MDWKALKDKALATSKDAFEKSKELSSKAMEQGKVLAVKAKELKDKGAEKVEEGKEKVQELKDKGEEKIAEGKSFADKMKNLGSKALDSTTGVLNKTSPQLKIMADYEQIKDSKLLVLLFLKKDDEESKKLTLMMPMILSNVWINSAIFRTIDIDDSKEVAENFGINDVPFLIVSEKGEEKKKAKDIEEIKKYLKDFTL